MEKEIKLKLLKEDFIAGKLNEHLVDQEYKSVIAGWKKSKSAGANPMLAKLTDEHRDTQVFSRISDLSKCHLAYFKEHYESQNKAMDRLSCALFYLDTDLVAFYKCGNKEVLDKLKEVGIRIGTRFSEKNVGVFAGNIALSKPFINCMTAGQGHYCNLLTDYVCMARYGEGNEVTGFQCISLIFIPLEKCYKNTINSVSYVLESEDFTYKKRILYPHVERRLHLLEQSAQYSADLMLLVDKDGEIVFINNLVEKEFGFEITPSIGRKIDDLFLELNFLKKAIKDGREISARDVAIEDKNGIKKLYYVDCIPIKEEQEILGVKITMKTTEQIRKYLREPACGGAIFSLRDMVGSKRTMEQIREQVHVAAMSFASILITGESGTGKELLAQSIHNAGMRADKAFIPINCGKSKERLEIELFGVENGNASLNEEEGVHGRPGKLEQANGGTIFLDEISELPKDIQSALLRFMDDGRITRIGGTESISLDVRIIASTNQNLQHHVENGRFRADLYYRINVIPLSLPPLRGRKEDISAITEHYVKYFAAQYGKRIGDISTEKLEKLFSYSWPGNIRELKNVIERAVIKAPDGGSLEFEINTGEFAAAIDFDNGACYKNYKEYEAKQITELLYNCGGNKSKMAKQLGISRGTLYKRLRELEIE